MWRVGRVWGRRRAEALNDVVAPFRVLELPGVEMLRLSNTSRYWRVVNTEFCVWASTSWAGDVTCDGRRYELTPGTCLCLAPGQIHTTPKTRAPGDFLAIAFTPEAFAGYLAEHAVARGSASWRRPVARLSPRLREELAAVVALAEAACAPLEVQERVAVLVSLALRELVAPRAQPAPLRRHAAERIRECLDGHRDGTLSLDEVARVVGLSRFQVVRAFTARYGLAPHAYQICRKISEARGLLRSGHSVADVAMTCGFADQSHFGRHFKRVAGLTPGEYARAARAVVPAFAPSAAVPLGRPRSAFQVRAS